MRTYGQLNHVHAYTREAGKRIPPCLTHKWGKSPTHICIYIHTWSRHLYTACPSPPQCHVCGSVRHTKKDCAKKAERCSFCGHFGHLKVSLSLPLSCALPLTLMFPFTLSRFLRLSLTPWLQQSRARSFSRSLSLSLALAPSHGPPTMSAQHAREKETYKSPEVAPNHRPPPSPLFLSFSRWNAENTFWRNCEADAVWEVLAVWGGYLRSAPSSPRL